MNASRSRSVRRTSLSFGDEENRAAARNGARTKGAYMGNKSSWTGWIGFAGLLMIVIGSLEFFEGLIAVIRNEYYVLTPERIIVFDLTTWGWLTMLWGIIVAFAGFGLLSRSGWARWFTIVVGSLNFLTQLSFLGESQYPLWSLTILGLTAIVLFALTVRWGEAAELA